MICNNKLPLPESMYPNVDTLNKPDTEMTEAKTHK